MNGARYKVLVVPEGGLYLAFRLLPILRRAGSDVEVLCVRGDPVAHSRYITKAHLEASRPDLARRLIALMADPARPWARVVVADELLARRIVATHDSSLLSHWQPGALDPLAREFFLSKLGLATAREQWRLPIPESRACETLDDVLAFGEAQGWPIMLKPPDGSGGAGVRRVDSPGALASLRAELRFPILTQRVIRGRTGVVDMLCSRGRVLAWLASYSIRKSAGGLGASSARLFQAMPAIWPIVEQVAARTRFDGFCGFDWIEEEETGRHWLTEFHPRPPSGFRFGRFCGVDFSAAARRWLEGTGMEEEALSQAPGQAVAAHYFSPDLLRACRDRDWRALKPWLPGSGACHDVFWDDWPLMSSWIRQRLAARWRRRAPEVAEGWEVAEARDY